MVKVESGSVVNRVDKISGTLKLTGLQDMLQAKEAEEFRVPLLDNGSWQILFRSWTDGKPLADRKISACFSETNAPGKLPHAGVRFGEYKVTITAPYREGMTPPPPFKAKQDKFMTKTSYSVPDWYTASQLNEPFSQKTSISWSIERNLPFEESPKEPLAEVKIVASLFNDQATSDVIFIIQNPRKNSTAEEQIYAHMFESTFSEGAAAVTSTNSTAMENGAQELEYFADSDYEGEQSPVVDRTNVFPQRDLNIRTVRITNVSYKTYYAMIYYLYTRSYAFAPLSSSRPLAFAPIFSNASVVQPVSPWGFTDVPVSSAKSMYRLCDRLDIPALKNAAMVHIKQSLTPQNITTEISSAFTTQFSEVRQIQKAYITSHWREVVKTATFKDYFARVFESEKEGVGATWVDVMKELPVK